MSEKRLSQKLLTVEDVEKNWVFRKPLRDAHLVRLFQKKRTALLHVLHG